MYFLLVYDRERGVLLSERVFESREDALQSRFRSEKEHRDGGHNVEIVVVGAASREDLQRTHGRYFFSLRELGERTNVAAR